MMSDVVVRVSLNWLQRLWNDVNITIPVTPHSSKIQRRSDSRRSSVAVVDISPFGHGVGRPGAEAKGLRHAAGDHTRAVCVLLSCEPARRSSPSSF